MITFVGGNLEVKLRLVRDSFYSWGVSKKKYGNQYVFLLSVKYNLKSSKKDNCQQEKSFSLFCKLLITIFFCDCMQQVLSL